MKIGKVIARTAICLMVAVCLILVVPELGKQTAPYQAYLLMDVTTLVAFAYGYYETKDTFWLIMLASVPFSLISDMYFIPSFQGFIWLKSSGAGVGMNMWQGLHLVILTIGCFFYFKETSPYRHLLVILMVLGMITNINLGSALLSRGTMGYMAALIWQVALLGGFLVHYGIKEGKYLFSAGNIVQLLGVFVGVWAFFRLSSVEPITLAWSDKIIVMGRLLTAIGVFEWWKER